MVGNRKIKSLLQILALRKIRNNSRKKARSMYMRSIFLNRATQGESILVKELIDDEYYHFRYFRMDKKNYEEILDLTSGIIKKAKTHRLPIPFTDKLALTLRYLATGNSQVSLGLNYRISPQSVSLIVREVMAAICYSLEPIYLPSPTEDTWKNSEVGFRENWQFPNAIGAMDGKHIRMQSPAFSGTTHYNYKGFYSVVLLAVVDPSYKFTVADIGHSGSQSDGGIYLRSKFGRLLEQNKMGVPGVKDVGDTELPHVILSNDAFSLKTFNMKPYPGKFLAKDKRIFNYRLSRARMTVENAFGILSARWRIFHTSINGNKDLVKLSVKTCVILHNFLLTKKDMNTITTDSQSGEAVGNWRNTTAGDNGVHSVTAQGSNNFTSTAAQVRDSFKEYFSTTGAVAWQDSRI